MAPLEGPSDLLARARTLRRNGQARDAATAYRHLQAAFPASEEARASLVSLGQLELSELGDASSALHCFDSYLARTDGALVEQAALGRIESLRVLGRIDDERGAIDGFLARHPDSLHGGALRARRDAARMR